MSQSTHYVDLCSGMSQISDAELERNLFRMKAALGTSLGTSGVVIVDFRHKQWFDLWALIQLLFMIGDERIKESRRIIRLLSPEAVQYDRSSTPEEFERKRKYAHARLRFLSEMEFLNRAQELGANIQLQLDAGQQKVESVNADDIRQLVLDDDFGELISDGVRPVIPITHFKTLDLKGHRDELFQRAKLVFGEFYSEAIVQQAGLGDCLLSELVMNVEHHGGKDGYIALRAGGGLRRIKRIIPEAYSVRVQGRTHHPLGDWRTYYKQNPDDGYFELIVADRGEGIASSIRADERLSLELKAAPKTPGNDHTLIKYALNPNSSRLNPSERRKRDLTDFTGLGAVSFVLSIHNGFLLVRENNARHVFPCVATQSEGVFDQVISKGVAAPSELSYLPGTSVTAVIPIKRVRYAPPGIKFNNTVLVTQQVKEESLKQVIVLRAQPSPKPVIRTFLDKRYGATLSTIAKKIAQLSDAVKVVLLDLHVASVNKNDLWSGLSKIRNACQTRNIALFISGIDQRIACRLEEYSELDKRKISNGEEWLLFGFGDDCKVYAFGSFGRTQIERNDILKEASHAFHFGGGVSAKIFDILNDSNYIGLTSVSDAELLPGLISSHAILRESLRSHYATAMQDEIRRPPAWLEGTNVRLNGGEDVGDYLDIHSVAQMRELYPDLSRLLHLIARPFDFNFVLSVGAISQTAARVIGQHISQSESLDREEFKIGSYTYHDYFGFDHGEDARQVINKNSKVLLLVDGVRRGEHGREVFEHVHDCGAQVVAVIALFDLATSRSARELLGVPLRCALEISVDERDVDKDVEFIESPYTYGLNTKSTEIAPSGWVTILNKRQTYRVLEGNGLILTGHKTFFEQHFNRVISLPYFLNSSTSLKAELVHSALHLIEQEDIDCIVFPEQSSISNLVDSLLQVPQINKKVTTVMCRRAVWPDRASGYTLDIVGTELLKRSRNVLILEDETYTGNSLKNLTSLCLSNWHEDLSKLVIMTVIDSMMRSERESLMKLLSRVAASSNDQLYFLQRMRPEIKYYTFMQLSLCSYWSRSTCPVCRRRRQFFDSQSQRLSFIEKAYAEERLVELEPEPIEQNYNARQKLHALRHQKELRRPSSSEVVMVSSVEGLELLCEEAYVEGDLEWLIERLAPNDKESFPVEVRLSILEMLSRDPSLLIRVRVRQALINNLRLLLAGRYLRGASLARFMEILCDWPLHFLHHLWEDLWQSFFSEEIKDLTECYPGAQLLLLEIEGRPFHQIQKKMLGHLDQVIASLIVRTQAKSLEQVVDEDTVRLAHVAMCLRRSTYRDKPIYTSKGALIAEITFLVAYFAPGKPHHWTLRKGLNLLSKCISSTDVRECMYIVEMGSHLNFALNALIAIDPDAAASLGTHPELERLRSSIEGLQNSYPRHGIIGERQEAIQRYASEILDILYEKEQTKGLKERLKELLGSYRNSMRDIIEPLTSWVSKDANVELSVSPNGVIEELDELYAVFNLQSVKEVFDELVDNMAIAKNNWLDKQNLSSVLFTPNKPFTINLHIEKSIDTLKLSITNPSTEADYDSLKAGTGGMGLGKIKIALERLGHTYLKPKFDPNKGTLTQLLSLRRMYK